MNLIKKKRNEEIGIEAKKDIRNLLIYFVLLNEKSETFVLLKV